MTFLNIFDPKKKTGKFFEGFILFLIMFSIILISIETFPSISETHKQLLARLEYYILIIFGLEYLIRIARSQKKLRYIFSFSGLVDALVIAPLFLTSGADLRILRGYRLLRLVQLLKLANYSSAIRRFQLALSIAKEEILVFLFFAFFILFVAAYGIYHFENLAQPEAFSSILDGLWWALATLTTVGYGDVYPVTAEGKIFTGLILIVGLGVVAVPTGLIASAITKARALEEKDERLSKDA
ncbi:ion transporter [Arenicellales bacterium IMCC58067]